MDSERGGRHMCFALCRTATGNLEPTQPSLGCRRRLSRPEPAPPQKLNCTQALSPPKGPNGRQQPHYPLPNYTQSPRRQRACQTGLPDDSSSCLYFSAFQDLFSSMCNLNFNLHASPLSRTSRLRRLTPHASRLTPIPGSTPPCSRHFQ